MRKITNILITGTGGQGLITLLKIVAEAALMEGLDVKTSELHGLAQRGGSVNVHIRIGSKIYSPIIPQGEADAIIALEIQEALAGVPFTSRRTSVLVNNFRVPTMLKDISDKEVKKEIKKATRKVKIIDASRICSNNFGTEVVSGIFMLGTAYSLDIIPLKRTSILKAMAKILPKKYLGVNRKAFELGEAADTNK